MGKKLPPAISQVGKLRWHFTALFEGPDGDAYIPRWDINPIALSNNGKYGCVLQKVVRNWAWFPFLYTTVSEPIEVDSLSKWAAVSAVGTKQLHHHLPVPDRDGKTGLEG